MSDSVKWTQEQAVALCRKIETFAPRYGCHVALTGGTLYHFGERKDADTLFYRVRQVTAIDVEGLMQALGEMGIIPGQDYGWCYKAAYEGKAIDFFFPEREGVDYPGHKEPASMTPCIATEDEIAF